MKIIHLAPCDLHPHPQNPRKHSTQQIRKIAKSIETFGFRVPVIVDGAGCLVCGHGRLEAAKYLGLESIPAIQVDDLSQAHLRAFRIADNRLTEIADWDEALLAENLKILSDLDLNFDLELTGFDYGDIERIVLEGEAEALQGEPTVPELKEASAVVQSGELWQCGQHRLLCADSTKPESYTALLDSHKKASVVFTDPPYNLPAKAISTSCAREHGDFTMGSGEMSAEAFTDFLKTIFKHLAKHSKNGSIHYICMDWRHATEVLAAGKACYTDYKNLCVWNKNCAGMGSFYRSQHELVFVFKNGKAAHANHFSLGQYGRRRSNIWSYPSVMHLKPEDGDKGGIEALSLHPTIKPVAMIEDALKDCSRRGEIVLDCFLGSGSTLIAAEKSKRVCYGIEYSARYLDVALRRWEEWTHKDAIHLASGATYKSLEAKHHG